MQNIDTLQLERQAALVVLSRPVMTSTARRKT